MGKVLIIDDEKQILSLLSRIIGLEGYEVFQATNCKLGIKQLEQNDPEVVLCDVCLPDGSGVELVSELKRLRPLSEVILLTAHGNIPDGVQAIKNGAFDYITKGDDNNKILPLIAKAMEKATVAYSQQKAVGKLLFESGSARVDKRGKEALAKLAEVLNKQSDIDVYIEGHTDSKPINTAQFKDNWDLSVIRATSVVRILTKDYGVKPLQIQPCGRGEFMPVADNETADGRAKNRRTEIIMAPKLDKLYQMLNQ